MKSKKIYTAIATFGFVFLGFLNSSNAYAALISTEQMVDKVQTSVSRDEVLTALARDDVRQLLISKGVDMDHAIARIDAMTDSEIASLQQDFDSLPAGAGAGSALVAVVLVFVILDIVGVTNVFSFIR